ncbi:hypothetical protein CSUI_009019, partial [Cystoisospora suis]
RQTEESTRSARAHRAVVSEVSPTSMSHRQHSSKTESALPRREACGPSVSTAFTGHVLKPVSA